MTASARKSPLAHDDVTRALARLVSDLTGVQLGDKQAAMVSSRLKGRILRLGLADEAAYLDYFAQNTAAETEALVSLFTTHHTFFFREAVQLDFIQDTALSRLVAVARQRGDKKIRVWSAACSRGQEAYSLAMILSYQLARTAPDVGFEVFGTDVDPESVQTARNGVYKRRELEAVPLHYLAGSWARGTGDIADFARANAVLRDHCRFEVGNLLALEREPVATSFDVIFCRNVFIYFTPEQTAAITRGLLARLAPEGLLAVGLSESLMGLGLDVRRIGPSLYEHPRAVAAATPRPVAVTKPLRVLCVDDSPSILALMRKILTKEHGFEIVATAGDGLEAARAVSLHAPDVMTLDIHMPRQTGIEYLASGLGATHPPVVMVTSVSREDKDLAGRALALGAADFIEKPELGRLEKSGEELRAKLLAAVRAKKDGVQRDLSFDKSSAPEPRPEADARDVARVIMAPQRAPERLAAYLAEIAGSRVPAVITVDTDDEKALESLRRAWPGVHVAGPKGLSAALRGAGRLLVQVLAGAEGYFLREAGLTGTVHILLEDGASRTTIDAATIRVSPGAVDVVPLTSFAYISERALARLASRKGTP